MMEDMGFWVLREWRRVGAAQINNDDGGVRAFGCCMNGGG